MLAERGSGKFNNAIWTWRTTKEDRDGQDGCKERKS